VSVNQSLSISLSYGVDAQITLDIERDRVAKVHLAPKPLAAFDEALRSRLEEPNGFPPLRQALVSGDRVAIALDECTPEAATIISEVWRVFESQSVSPENVTIVQPARAPSDVGDPRQLLPESVRKSMKWTIHDINQEDALGYLATTSNGDRIYLASEIVKADFVLPIGPIAFDPLMGYQGTYSVLFPRLSSAEAINRWRGQEHGELAPENARPLRQIVDEIGWLMGVQFCIQTVAATQGGVSEVLAGATDAVFSRGRDLLQQNWVVHLDARPSTVVATIDKSATQGWDDLAAAISTASRLVAANGRIIVLSEFNVELGAGLRLLQASENPSDAITPLRSSAPADLLPATRLAVATDWARVYLYSHLDSDLVEDLFMVPLQDENEVRRLLTGDESYVFLESANHTFGTIG
jgi:nickel-dependent lactate racemase